MKEKILENKKNILIILGVIVAIILIIIRLFIGSSNDRDINIVKSSSRFYTVSNCVSRYINYLYSEDTDNILLILDSSYKKKNKINSDNLFDKIGKLDEFYDFEARKMYEEVVNEHLVKYYVYGYLNINDIFNNESSSKDYYIIIYLDSKNSTYSVEPYDGKLFKNGGINERK